MIHITRGDKLVLLLATVMLPTLYLQFWNDGRPGDQARILVAGQQARLVDLHQDQRIVVRGMLGDSVLEISNGKIRFVDSPCDNKQCVHEGWHQYGGQTAACLPNKVSVAILGGEQRFDAINF